MKQISLVVWYKGIFFPQEEIKFWYGPEGKYPLYISSSPPHHSFSQIFKNSLCFKVQVSYMEHILFRDLFHI